MRELLLIQLCHCNLQALPKVIQILCLALLPVLANYLQQLVTDLSFLDHLVHN